MWNLFKRQRKEQQPTAEQTPSPVPVVTPEPVPAPSQPHIDAEQVSRDVTANLAQQMATRLLDMVPVQPAIAPTVQTHSVYALNRPFIWNVPQTPERRPLSLVSVDTLRAFAENYDILRDCINQLKREVEAATFEVVPINSKDKSEKTKKRCAEAMQLFARKGPVGGVGQYFAHFQSQLLEDVLVIGAGAIYHRRNAMGGWLDCSAIDATTIRPLLDAYGWPAMDDTSDAYEQYIYGVPVTRLTRQDLDYDGIHNVSYAPYAKSPVEWLIYVVNAALRADAWNLSWLTDGNTPDEMYGLPQEWSVDACIQFAEWWDGLLAGNTSERRKTRFIPGGTGSVKKSSRVDQDFQNYELWLMRRCCAIMGVQPASIGFVGEQYKVTQDAAFDQTSQFGVGQLLAYRKRKLDDILERAGYGDLETQVTNTKQTSAKELAETLEIKVRSGQMTPNEARAEQGLPPLEGGDVLFVPATWTPAEEALRALESPEETETETDPNATDPNDKQGKQGKTQRVERNLTGVKKKG